jgi:pimeloyl-ACP methyl ester carboxylesterase
MEAMAEDVLALCDAQGVERFGLLGLSMGGYVALELQRIAPTRVERLVLAATQAAPDTPEQRDGREKLARELDGDGIQPLLDAFLPKLLSERAQLDAVLESKVRALIVSNAPDAMAAALRGMAQRRDHRARLASVACPVLVIAGSDDKAVPPARSQEMAQALPNARLVDVPGVGHLVNLEAPEAFNAALHSFMAEAEVAVSSR